MDFATDAVFAAKRRKPWYIKVGRKLLKRVDAVIERNSLVPVTEFFDTCSFPWVAGFEANWPLIRAELDRVMLGHQQLPNLQDISEDQKHITQDTLWKIFYLYGYGYRNNGASGRLAGSIISHLGDLPLNLGMGYCALVMLGYV